MKANFLVLLAAIIVAFTFVACKKDNSSNLPAKDYSVLFKNTVWTGEFHYAALPVQPMSIEFKSGGQFTWYEWSSEYTGTWKVVNNEISISFSSGSGFKATITDDDKLTNIVYASGTGYIVDNTSLNKEAEPVLENTTWSNNQYSISFKAGNLLDLSVPSSGSAGGGASYRDRPYIRRGRSIRFDATATYKWFAILNSASAMKTASVLAPSSTLFTFQLNKR